MSQGAAAEAISTAERGRLKASIAASHGPWTTSHGRVRLTSPPWLIAALCLTLPSCSLLLDFDQPLEKANDIDAALTSADALPDFDARIASFCDQSEPNDKAAEAFEIVPASYDAALCPTTDVDFFVFTLLADSAVTARVEFENGDGANLDLRLLNNMQVLQTQAATDGAVEEITHSKDLDNALPGGTYYLEVYSADDGNLSVDYQLSLEVSADPAP